MDNTTKCYICNVQMYTIAYTCRPTKSVIFNICDLYKTNNIHYNYESMIVVCHNN